jgi:predicted membrane-bound dolichyl-phosphate-mannose-protein mannosyltransferase
VKIRRLAGVLRESGFVLPIVLLAAFIARGIWIDLPPQGLIFDEAYYVNAARILLGWTVPADAPYAGSPVGLDPNLEHPPLGKVLIALSMLVFGDNGLGWRLPSVLAGMGALIALYLVVRAAGETAWVATLAVSIMAFDNLTLVHGRIGTLDMIALLPILLAAWLALRDRWVLAGVLVGIGFLVKLTALYGLLAIMVLLAIRVWTSWRRGRSVSWPGVAAGATLVASFSIVAVGGLWILDGRFTTFSNPFDHVAHMVRYGASLTEPIDHSGICVSATSAPWQWPFNECQINYLRVDETVSEGGVAVSRYAIIDFRGALNPLLAGAIPLASLMTVWLAWRTGSVAARWAAVWAAANYLPFVALTLIGGRVTYIYYFLPVIPAAAVMVALLLLRSGLPRLVLWGYVVVYAFGFAAYFPFRQLP